MAGGGSRTVSVAPRRCGVVSRCLAVFLCIATALLSANLASAAEDPEGDLLKAVNSAREKRVLSPLLFDRRLAKAADLIARYSAKPGRKVDYCRLIEDAGVPCTDIGVVASSGGKGSVGEIASGWFNDVRTQRTVANNRFGNAGVGVERTVDPQLGPMEVWVLVLGNPPKPAERNWRHSVLREVNAFRARHGLPPLRLVPVLNEAAQRHADDMAYRDYFAHETPAGKGPGDRAADVGYRGLVLENLAAGMGSPAAAVKGWIESKTGHREAMLNRDIRDVGIGYRFLSLDRGKTVYTHYWAMSMGRRGNS